MEQSSSTSRVTVEYFDPHDVYKLLEPGLLLRLPLHDLHWQSHAGPARSISSLHVELLSAQTDPFSLTSPDLAASPLPARSSERDDGFTTQAVGGGRTGSTDQVDAVVSAVQAGTRERRHQIPGLRRTPYLKILLIRCDDNDTYKGRTRTEIREWVKKNTPPAQSTRKVNSQENHDAFEWLIIHVVIPNTSAAAQPRTSAAKVFEPSTGDGSGSKGSSTSRWRSSSSTLLEKLRSDFNGTGKSAVDRVAQIRIGANDVPYDLLPSGAASGPTESSQESENAWFDLVDKLKNLILSSFDLRVSQYEEDIREKDAQRNIPGWNFCTFFILKEGLARGFESVGLVEDALVGYDELSVGLDAVVQSQSANVGGAGALLEYTSELKDLAHRAIKAIDSGQLEVQDDDPVVVDLQSPARPAEYDDIAISSTKKPYREMVLANNVSLFDFRCYIFSRQITLLLRLGNAWSTREELLAQLREQQESILNGLASNSAAPRPTDESENLSILAEICRRTLEFIPAVSQVMRRDIRTALTKEEASDVLDAVSSEALDNLVASFAFSVAQQILAQTSSKALPIPPSALGIPDGHEPKASIPEPKTMMHPARSTSLHVRSPTAPPTSPGIFPGPERRASHSGLEAPSQNQLLKTGVEELAAKRAELYALSRNILEESGKKRGWGAGWDSAPVLGELGGTEMVNVSLNDEAEAATIEESKSATASGPVCIVGIQNRILRTALDHKDDFYRLYETLTDKALRHYSIADHTNSVQATMADLAVLRYHLGDYDEAATYFNSAIPYFGSIGWTLLELSMLLMYSRCLRQLQRPDKYVQVLIKLLSKAATAERDRQQQHRLPTAQSSDFSDSSVLAGVLYDLLAATEGLPSEVRIPLSNFITDLEIDGPPGYDEGQDSFTLQLSVNNLLPEGLELSSAKARIAGTAAIDTTGGPREVWLETRGAVHLKPGRGKITLRSQQVLPGIFEMDIIRLTSGNVCLFHERSSAQSNDSESILRKPTVNLFQRAGSLDIRLTAGKHIQLDKNNTLDLELLTGWNDIKSCEVRIRSATGGLRLVMAEAEIVSSSGGQATHPEGSLFTFTALPPSSSAKIRFPFSTEQEVINVALRVDVQYTTERGSFAFTKTPSVPVVLALGVNVQDVFKHDALFSRFTVSTASASPLRLFRSELLGSELFESYFGFPPSDPVLIFPKQPASLLYKIRRKSGVRPGPKTQKMMYLKLYYSVLQEEIEGLVERSIGGFLQSTDLAEYAPILLAQVRHELLTHGLTPYDLERAALLGELPTSWLSDVQWEKAFPGLASPRPDGKTSVAGEFASFLKAWQEQNQTLRLADQLDPSADAVRSILIPVDIPSVVVVHTADIRLQEQAGHSDPSPSLGQEGGLPVVCVNQLVPATLHLKWTHIWDTAGTTSGDDLEFSYEVNAPTDTWLLGGRRKGHFVIPGAASDDSDDLAGMSSTPDTEADIPLLLVPLREGWLPFPTVEIREVSGGGGDPTADTAQHYPSGQCETDWRNLGETLRVVADRARVTLSLDASGPGGGPLVLESEPWAERGRAVV